MYKNKSTPSNNITLWHHLGTKRLDYRHENNSTPGVLIKEIRLLSIHALVYFSYCTEMRTDGYHYINKIISSHIRTVAVKFS